MPQSATLKPLAFYYLTNFSNFITSHIYQTLYLSGDMSMTRIMLIAGLALTVAFAAGGCSSKEKQNLEKFTRAEALFENVKRLVAEGKLDEAHTAFCEAKDILSEIRRRSGPARMGDYDLPSGPKLKGITAQQWQDRWKAELEETVERNFDKLVAMASAGQLDWNRTRGFLNTYGGKLADRWVETAAAVDAASAGRQGDVYLFECESDEMGNCETLRGILAPKMAKPVSTEKFLTGDARHAAFGIIQIKVQLGNWQSYEKVDSSAPSGRGGGGITIPSRVYAIISVSTHKGRSSWDGERTLTADTELPATLADSAMYDTKKKHIELLKQRIEQQLSSLEAQSLTP
jgi:hypothetical protein